MEATKVGIREFRAGMAEFITSSTPVAVTRHGQTIGYFIPTHGQAEADVAALKKASKTLDRLLAAKSIDVDAVVSEFKTTRKRASTLEKRGVNSEAALTVLDALESIVQPLELGVYSGFQAAALQRIAMRDADDWPVLACAMTIACPVWTEDADFFGTGIATWTTDRVELYLAG